jgi:8-oxo-dGTP pyrophosphatase MutT (NUDIX family)
VIQQTKEDSKMSVLREHYVSPVVVSGDSPHPPPLPKELFDRVVQTWPRLCADVVIIDRENRLLFLTPRKADPAGDWFIGGSIVARETEIQAAIRKLKAETGLDIAPACLSWIWLKRYMFKHWDSCCYLFALELTPDERTAICLDEAEYHAHDGLRPFTRDDLQRKCEQTVGQESPYPILLMAYDAVFGVGE